MRIFAHLNGEKKYMQRCLQLALKGAGHTAPNPMVGAVLVYNDAIIGEGFHRQFGSAHAEVNCIKAVSPENEQYIAESTLYVSLEPCVHFGKTPPCVDLIIEKKIPVVVIGCKDSNTLINGKGIAKLEANGIKVISGICEKACVELNKRFFTFHQQQRPYIILKWAQSNDKKIAKKDKVRVFISNEITNRLVHKWRSEEAAILVGTHTALIDDPALTNRYWPDNIPIRLVIDRQLKLPETLQLFDRKTKTIVFNQIKNNNDNNLVFHKVDNVNDIAEMMKALYEMQVQSVIVEGGSTLLQSFIDAGLWDEARVITNEQLVISNGIDAPILKNEGICREEQLLSDTITYYVNELF